MKKIIRLTESDIYNLVKRVINEQNSTNNGILTDQEAVRNIELDINNIISKKQNEIFSRLTLKWKSGGDNKPVILSVLFDGKDISKDIVMHYDVPNRQWVAEVEYINMGKYPISEYLEPVYQNGDYKILFKKHPSIEQQVKYAKASCFMIPQNKENGLIRIVGGLVKGKNKGSYSIEEPIPFGSRITTDGQGSNSFSIQVNKKLMFNFELGNSMLFLNQFKIDYNSAGEPKTKPIGGFASITLNNQGSEPFKYDKTDLTKESIQQINEFVGDIKQINKKYGMPTYNKYIDILKKNPITVLAYSSIDEDSNAKAHGTYLDCRGHGDGTRGQYNLCLSQARADKIAKILNEKLPEIGNFVGKGMGETNNFGPGWTKEKPTTNTETLPNRKFEVKLPTVTLNNPK